MNDKKLRINEMMTMVTSIVSATDKLYGQIGGLFDEPVQTNLRTLQENGLALTKALAMEAYETETSAHPTFDSVAFDRRYNAIISGINAIREDSMSVILSNAYGTPIFDHATHQAAALAVIKSELEKLAWVNVKRIDREKYKEPAMVQVLPPETRQQPQAPLPDFVQVTPAEMEGIIETFKRKDEALRAARCELDILREEIHKMAQADNTTESWKRATLILARSVARAKNAVDSGEKP